MSCPCAIAPSVEISVVIPFFNEAESCEALLLELRLVMSGLGGSYEVLCVNDGSADSTSEALERACSGWPEASVCSFTRNHGQATALFFGVHRAAGRFIATLDGDGQNDPADLPGMIGKLAAADMVTGTRVNRQDSWLRRRMSRFANAIRSRFLGDGVRDTGCALKVFRREVREAFIPIRTLYSFTPALAVAAGFRVIEMEVNHRRRTRGESKYGLGVMLWRPLVDMLGVWWFTRRRCELPGGIAVRRSEAAR
ncbi:MAG: glycosyltransferase family 2 protein [Chthoniobacteraceae bacterium]